MKVQRKKRKLISHLANERCTSVYHQLYCCHIYYAKQTQALMICHICFNLLSGNRNHSTDITTNGMQHNARMSVIEIGSVCIGMHLLFYSRKVIWTLFLMNFPKMDHVILLKFNCNTIISRWKSHVNSNWTLNLQNDKFGPFVFLTSSFWMFYCRYLSTSRIALRIFASIFMFKKRIRIWIRDGNSWEGDGAWLKMEKNKSCSKPKVVDGKLFLS